MNINQVLGTTMGNRRGTILARRWPRPRLDCTIGLLLIVLVGCDPTTGQRSPQRAAGGESHEQLHSLGWLGGRSQPLKELVEVADAAAAEAARSRNGVVLRDLFGGSPLIDAGLKTGDAILRVGDKWLPINEDPTLDLIAAIEDQISAGNQQIKIGYMRDGRFETAVLQANIEGLDEGLPLATARWSDASLSCLRRLATLQNNNGSFPTADQATSSQLLAAAICGLAFLSVDEQYEVEFRQPLDRCLNFVADNTTGINLQSAAIPAPLIAAYIGQLVAEANVDFTDERWLDVAVVVMETFTNDQHENGAWAVSELDHLLETTAESNIEVSSKMAQSDLVASAESNSHAAARFQIVLPPAAETDELDDTSAERSPHSADSSDETGGGLDVETVDVIASFTTNQVLLAIGGLERIEFADDAKMIEKGCGYLLRQAKLRVPAAIDRRVKAALSAGSAAALVALNCQRNDPHLRQLLDEVLSRSHDLYTADSLSLPGLLHASIAAKQMGTASWLRFYQSVKYLLVAICEPDGRVLEYPGVERSPFPFETVVDAEVWRTAHVAMVMSLQSPSLENLLAINTSLEMTVRDSSGRPAPTIDPNRSAANSAEAEALKKMIFDELRKQGMEIDESQLKVQSESAANSDEK